MVEMMALRRADGSRPFQGAKPPANLFDFEAQGVLGDDRLRRFQSRTCSGRFSSAATSGFRCRSPRTTGERDAPLADNRQSAQAETWPAILVWSECTYRRADRDQRVFGC